MPGADLYLLAAKPISLHETATRPQQPATFNTNYPLSTIPIEISNTRIMAVNEMVGFVVRGKCWIKGAVPSSGSIVMADVPFITKLKISDAK